MITPGSHVEVAPLDRPNPWDRLQTRLAWRGRRVYRRPRAGSLAGAVLPPWCELGISRVMPASVLREAVVGPANHVAKPEPQVIPPDAPTVRVKPNAGTSAGRTHCPPSRPDRPGHL